MPDSPTDWLQFVGTLVVCFGVPIEDAWHCTVREFWAIMDVHLVKTGQKKKCSAAVTFNSSEDVTEFEKYLAEIGALE